MSDEYEYVSKEFRRAALKCMAEYIDNDIIGNMLSCMPEWELCEEP